MPMENSGTAMPTALAVRKCPSSWMMIITPKIRIANRIVTNRFIQFLLSSIELRIYFPYRSRTKARAIRSASKTSSTLV